MNPEIVELQVQVRELKERLTAHELQDEQRHSIVAQRLDSLAWRLDAVERRLMTAGGLGTLIIVLSQLLS